jgi:hypothetical protein
MQTQFHSTRSQARMRFRQRYPFWANDAKVGFSAINAKAETIVLLRSE